jgi:hypothetical protein
LHLGVAGSNVEVSGHEVLRWNERLDRILDEADGSLIEGMPQFRNLAEQRVPEEAK